MRTITTVLLASALVGMATVAAGVLVTNTVPVSTTACAADPGQCPGIFDGTGYPLVGGFGCGVWGEYHSTYIKFHIPQDGASSTINSAVLHAKTDSGDPISDAKVEAKYSANDTWTTGLSQANGGAVMYNSLGPTLAWVEVGWVGGIWLEWDVTAAFANPGEGFGRTITLALTRTDANGNRGVVLVGSYLTLVYPFVPMSGTLIMIQ